MILFAGIPSEAPLGLAIAAAEALGLPHLVLNQRHAALIDLTLTWGGGGGLGGSLSVGGASTPLAAVTGIYARPVEAAVLPETKGRGRAAPDPGTLRRIQAFDALLNDLLDGAEAPVVNRPAAMGSNASKPFQAQAIRAAGLLVPETLVSNDQEAVRAFRAEHGRLVYKSISALRSIVTEWRPGTGPSLDAVSCLPTQFQAFVPGTNVRVHVVGEAVFATEILSDAVDYRYASRDGHDLAMRPCRLPADLEETCRRLTAELGLTLSGIDLKRDADGAWYCFEVNPSPAYSVFEEGTGQPIARTLVSLLAGRA